MCFAKCNAIIYLLLFIIIHSCHYYIYISPNKNCTSQFQLNALSIGIRFQFVCFLVSALGEGKGYARLVIIYNKHGMGILVKYIPVVEAKIDEGAAVSPINNLVLLFCVLLKDKRIVTSFISLKLLKSKAKSYWWEQF